ncbi:hypothetical protein E3N88_18036 [Mikania micrantha]|uniref:Uncharacterized protein n=1 Tax=Mikania micrantha TaxID=192012 RepID=A0A5N6NUY9_9ASTR|nr:hypothetical protein E3N88_18036 [Mikania micrantha]
MSIEESSKNSETGETINFHEDENGFNADYMIDNHSLSKINKYFTCLVRERQRSRKRSWSLSCLVKGKQRWSQATCSLWVPSVLEPPTPFTAFSPELQFGLITGTQTKALASLTF